MLDLGFEEDDVSCYRINSFLLQGLCSLVRARGHAAPLWHLLAGDTWVPCSERLVRHSRLWVHKEEEVNLSLYRLSQPSSTLTAAW